MLEAAFWVSAAAVVYAYAGYPLLLWALVRVRPHGGALPPLTADGSPGVTMIVPAHNEVEIIAAKVANCRRLRYPTSKLRVIFVSDGSTDGTAEVLREACGGAIELIELPERAGKAAALNAALAACCSDIVVFSDAAIELREDALLAIVRPFQARDVGCVSGEDHVPGGGEGLYGRYELFVRRQESRLYSLVGASGSFYAQRRELCPPFVPNLAPDFLSVLVTVQCGYRAVAAPDAVGSMAALSNASDEFRRKVRTILRGITTLAHHARLLNPFRYGAFAFELLSHKLARWCVPFFLFAMLVSSAMLAAGSGVYRLLFVAQVVFYGLGAAALSGSAPLARLLPARIALYFTTVNLATLFAWLKYASGARQELWAPSRR